MAKTLNQLGQLTQVDDADMLLIRDTSTGDDKYVVASDFWGSASEHDSPTGVEKVPRLDRMTAATGRAYAYAMADLSEHESPTDVEKVARLDRLVDGGQINTGQTESVTLSTGTLTIPVGMSTIKLPTSVWDGSSNITISAIALEGGVQPAVGYEFSVVVPKTTDVGSLTAGALGNEVLIQDGASIAVEANNNADLPCYPNAADNPDTDPVQFAAPYYRLEFRVDEYDGNGDPVVSLVRLPDAVSGSNDNSSYTVFANGAAEATGKKELSYDSLSNLVSETLIGIGFSSISSLQASASPVLSDATPSQDDLGATLIFENSPGSVRVELWRVEGQTDFASGDTADCSYLVKGRWY